MKMNGLALCNGDVSEELHKNDERLKHLGCENGKDVHVVHDYGLSSAFPGWFSEITLGWPDNNIRHSHKIVKILFNEKTEQGHDLLVFEFLDGSLQLTKRDEFAYQEMLTHLRLCFMGDGGILKEAPRHPSLEQIDICELDQTLIDRFNFCFLSFPNPIISVFINQVYKRFFPDIAIAYEDPRVRVHIGDARALRPGGVLSAPNDSLWCHQFDIGERDTIANCHKVFKGSVKYASTTVPAYPSGAIRFMLCATEGPEVDFNHPINPLNPKSCVVAKEQPKFYNSQTHTAAFCLPAFAKKLVHGTEEV
ncbi:hypothetical protein UlMin_008022 [Ulmus minor]